jgi:microcystin-dependent protein
MDPYLGEIRLFAVNFAPRYWAFCHGQILPISQNSALFSILRTTYGGNGITHFALPDFRGRAPVGFGNGPNLSAYTIGQQTGNASNTLNTSQLPPHTHTIGNSLNLRAADQESPVGNYFADDGTARFDVQHDGITIPYNPILNDTGGNVPFTNMKPYLALHYIICIEAGVYPTP